MDAEVSDNAELERYEIHSGGELAGFVTYQSRRGIIALMHTETLPEFKGQGFASKLVRGALEDARARELRVLPFCPYVIRFIQSHDEYLELVPAELRAKFDLE